MGQKRCKSLLTVKLITLKIEIFVVVNQLAVNISLSMFSIAIVRRRTSDISCIQPTSMLNNYRFLYQLFRKLLACLIVNNYSSSVIFASAIILVSAISSGSRGCEMNAPCAAEGV